MQHTRYKICHAVLRDNSLKFFLPWFAVVNFGHLSYGAIICRLWLNCRCRWIMLMQRRKKKAGWCDGRWCPCPVHWLHYPLLFSSSCITLSNHWITTCYLFDNIPQQVQHKFIQSLYESRIWNRKVPTVEIITLNILWHNAVAFGRVGIVLTYKVVFCLPVSQNWLAKF